MNYNLNAGCWESVFAVPGAVVDNYIKLASGSAVKVLLYILKNNSRDVSRSEISSALNISEDDVSDAFNFWEEVNIINKSQKTADNTRNIPNLKQSPQKVIQLSQQKFLQILK